MNLYAPHIGLLSAKFLSGLNDSLGIASAPLSKLAIAGMLTLTTLTVHTAGNGGRLASK